jgi:hypothetical protein
MTGGWALGLLAWLAGWLAWRWVAGARPGRGAQALDAAAEALRRGPPSASPGRGERLLWQARDAAPGLGVAALVLAASGRPALAGVVAGALLAGLALADATKRRVLREPLLFLDAALLVEVLRHPHLYLPFAGPWRLGLAVGVPVLAGALLLALEPVAVGGPVRGAAALGGLGLIGWWWLVPAEGAGRPDAARAGMPGPGADAGVPPAAWDAPRADRGPGPADAAARPPSGADDASHAGARRLGSDGAPPRHAAPPRPPPPGRDAAFADDARERPLRDAARFGPAATLALHAAIARAERPARRAALAPDHRPLALPDPAPHVLLLQLESFWDARGRVPLDTRSHGRPGARDSGPSDARDRGTRGDAPALPAWDALGAAALARGRVSVGGFGANTMRAEFAALTGAAEEALGLDAANPYAAFARAPVRSLAHRLAASGYATRALHPHDRRFFGRDRVLPALGFQHFEGEEAFAGSPREGRYVSDAALGQAIMARLVAAETPVLLFAISMAAHGPWPGPDPFAGWAARIAATDRMLGALAEAARALPRPVLLLAWGDHAPSLPETARLTDPRTDWLLWHSARPGQGERRDIAAADIPGLVQEALGA